MKVVILAGGFGTRISEESHLRPKPMIEIGGKPILWHIMKIFEAYGHTDFIICLGYKAFMVREYFVNYVLHNSDLTISLRDQSTVFHNRLPEDWKVTLIYTGEATQTGGRVARIRNYLTEGEPFFLTYGDGVADVNLDALVKFHQSSKNTVTLTATVPPGRFGALEMDGDKVVNFVEKPAGDGGRINGGFFVVEQSALDEIDGDDCVWEHKPLQNIAARGELGAYAHDGFWQPMDTLRDKELLQRLWEAGNAPWKFD